MIVITVYPNGWSCNCTDDFHSTLTPMSAERDALAHRNIHTEARQYEPVTVRKFKTHKEGSDA